MILFTFLGTLFWELIVAFTCMPNFKEKRGLMVKFVLSCIFLSNKSKQHFCFSPNYFKRIQWLLERFSLGMNTTLEETLEKHVGNEMVAFVIDYFSKPYSAIHSN